MDGEMELLTHEIHNIVVKFNLRPIFKHRLECGTHTLCSFCLRNCQDLNCTLRID